MENQDHNDSDSFCSQDFAIRNMFEDASLNDPMPSTPNNESGNITLPSLSVPDIGAAPTDQEDKVKNVQELTRPLKEKNASLNLMAKKIHEGRYRPCWVTKIKFLPDIYLRGERDERDRINREARQLAPNACNKYKAESLAFLGKEIQTTKMAMETALTTAKSSNTKELRQLSKGLNAAIAAEAAKNKEVLGAEDNPPQRESYQYRPHRYTRSGGRGSSRRGRGYDTQRYWWDPPPKNHFFQDPP